MNLTDFAVVLRRIADERRTRIGLTHDQITETLELVADAAFEAATRNTTQNSAAAPVNWIHGHFSPS